MFLILIVFAFLVFSKFRTLAAQYWPIIAVIFGLLTAAATGSFLLGVAALGCFGWLLRKFSIDLLEQKGGPGTPSGHALPGNSAEKQVHKRLGQPHVKSIPLKLDGEDELVKKIQAIGLGEE